MNKWNEHGLRLLRRVLLCLLVCHNSGVLAQLARAAPTNAEKNLTDLNRIVYNGPPIRFDGVPAGTQKAISFQIEQNLSSYQDAILFINVDDVDDAEEATIQLNGHKLKWPMTALGERWHSGVISVEPSWLKLGQNNLSFSFDSTLGGTTGGFEIVSPIVFIAKTKSASLPLLDYEKVKAEICWDEQTGRANITNGRLELIVETKSGLNANHLRNLATGRVYADDDYIWPHGKLPTLWSSPVIRPLPDGGQVIIFNAKLDDLLITQQFSYLSDQTGVIMEKITIGNAGNELLDTSGFACGFAKNIYVENRWCPDVLQSTFAFIPLRRYRGSGIRDFTVMDVARKPYEAPAAYVPAWTSKAWGSESFGWTQADNTLLITKYNNKDMEWSLLEVVESEEQPTNKSVLRFGGCGLWKLGDPERAAALKPGETFTFGITRLQALDGDWKDAFYAHRAFMDSQGHFASPDYDPPVQWNELFDNEYYFKVVAGPGYQPDFVKKMHNTYYTLDHMRQEAAKARELGCECLYLDPGWDTGAATTVWDEQRLGTQKDFIAMLRQEYGIAHLGLWCALAHAPPGYTDPRPYGPQAARRDKSGGIIAHQWTEGPTDQHESLPLICSYSPAYHDVKRQQLLTLVENGAKFLMYDGSQYTGVCYDPSHGHSIPLTRHEHIMSYCELVKAVMEKYPDTLIELHDPITGPTSERYPPLYFCHARPAKFELWGYEYMWEPMQNLLDGRAKTLYYTNLGCNIPIYLHINLKTDNENALVFWYYASLCRHLGVGGKHNNPQIWQAHKNAMKTYLRLKTFFTRGDFYGLDELTHIHTLPDKNAAVINCFNISQTPVTKTLVVNLPQIGLSSLSKYRVTGAASWRQDADKIEITVELEGRDTGLVEIIVSP